MPADPGQGIADIHGLMIRELRADYELIPLVADRIYARVYPARVHLPALRVNFPNANGIAQPTIQWFSYDGQVDVHAETHIDGRTITAALQRALLRLQGVSYPEGWVAAVDPFGVWSGFDAEWTPPKPRWIVSMLVTASAARP